MHMCLQLLKQKQNKTNYLMFQEFLSKLKGITRVIVFAASLTKQNKTKQNKNYQLCQMTSKF